ncbi:hypothetical protein GNY06_11980 [Elizabethkingia argentiflava]|uniref:Lipoprotein n=1 Tax=Elizabethkingia argenteiflava TaxID=2681556 RepID=A0A845PWP4_9FLAO|nr:hypothetical protein [Elizabethkingia argenteiflava]NAW52055.1 hypothetical protein [Elizabethkingia argenteiflava]
MKKIHNALSFFSGLFIILGLIACNKKYSGKNTIETVKYNNNTTTYSPVEFDSVQARNYITGLKLQELYDLAAHYAAGNKDSDIDFTLYHQIQEYFDKPDSSKINSFINELDSLKARFVKINAISTFKEIHTKKDTLDFAKYRMDYYDGGKKYAGYLNKQVQYILKEVPVKEKKFKREFKFYFVDFKNPISQKDSVSLGKTK